ncbi:MAG TPA: thioredoxin domain-containing protein [Candidatus Acidoferrum sp.]|nr:thioredoxin domain-containing protein [Candidatus Acidoferrum sp.]
MLGVHGVLAQNAPVSPAASAQVATDPAKDAALKTYLQKHFKIPDANSIKLGTAFKTPLDGLLGRQMTVSTPQGQTVAATLFFDKNEDKAIIGQLIDTTTEPWGPLNMGAVTLDDRPTQGPANAPVTIVEFADFECPFCAHAFSVLETLVNTTYKGKVKVIFKAYPLNVHPWAIKAAEAAECARMQNPDAFWDFARYFYTNQGSIDVKNLPDHVDKLAKSQKLDGPSLKACMDNPQTEARIKQDQLDGNSIHVSSTPTFFVNGIPIVGLPDEKIIDFVINAELAAK